MGEILLDLLDSELVEEHIPLMVLAEVAVATLEEAISRRGRIDDLYGHLLKIFDLAPFCEV